jgi:hypothetical protein
MKKWLVINLINSGASFRYSVHARRLTKCINSASNEDMRHLTSSLALLWSTNWSFWSAKLNLATLHRASSAAKTWTVEAGCLASLINESACDVSLPPTSFPTKIVILSAKLVKTWAIQKAEFFIFTSIILRANLLNLYRLFSFHQDFQDISNAKLGHCFRFTLTGGCCKAFYFLKNNLLIHENI